MRLNIQDTIVAPATIPGTGAITIIRISGGEALETADKVITCKGLKISESKGYTIKFGTILDSEGKVLDEVLVSVFRAPHSYTGEDSVEISCHASSYIAQNILMLLVKAGARMAEAGEFTKRAYVNGKMDLAQAESVADLIASQDQASHRVAMNQLRGGISSELQALRARLLEMTALMELELDFSEEDVEFADREKLSDLLRTVLSKVTVLSDSFRMGNAIKNGIPVAIVGAANTGKSTLLNALLGEERAIVSDIAGTTRDTIEEAMVIDGVRFRFIDTAGIRETAETVEKIGIERTFKKLDEAEIVLGMVDATAPFEEVSQILRQLVSKVDMERQMLAILVNKTDISGVNKNVCSINNLVLSIDDKIVTFEIAAKVGSGVDSLKKWLSGSQKDLLAASQDSVLVTNLRHFEALDAARTSLLRVQDGLALGMPSDLVAQDLRDSINALGSILGESITPDETLGVIFSRFCIG
ncbi:MAG: tRNA uridine-5-carboxymethylaminomethyl(34) synthesis GTPase MnmE, partial [Bacteroidales bacterium]|nr:tRNA uridine-5-carboxymethylaminomethyl(34) synthesis GTPase MnmE [Bacteroidales bacterium]